MLSAATLKAPCLDVEALCLLLCGVVTGQKSPGLKSYKCRGKIIDSKPECTTYLPPTE